MGSELAPISKEEHVYDPLQAQKTAVANPLSTFLASRVGTGIGEHPTDPNYTNRYNEFMQVNPSQYFDQNIADPATKRYKEDFLPIIQEGYAGNLRGSGRYGAEEAGINRFSEDLASAKATFVPSFSKSQLDVGQSEFTRQYNNWYQGLAENNPVLAQAINFINAGHTNTDSYTYDTTPSGGSSDGGSGGSFLSSLFGVAGGAIGTYLGGPLGGTLGTAAGSYLGSKVG